MDKAEEGLIIMSESPKHIHHEEKVVVVFHQTPPPPPPKDQQMKEFDCWVIHLLCFHITEEGEE